MRRLMQQPWQERKATCWKGHSRDRETWQIWEGIQEVEWIGAGDRLENGGGREGKK